VNRAGHKVATYETQNGDIVIDLNDMIDYVRVNLERSDDPQAAGAFMHILTELSLLRHYMNERKF
jgi:hypothetical protein